MAKPPYNSAGWRKLSKYVIDRDGGLCRIRLPGCTITATTADHIVTANDGGAWLDPLNLRAACRPCNSARAAITTKARRRRVTGRDDGGADGPAHAGPSRDW